jgi:hypothetical protein
MWSKVESVQISDLQRKAFDEASAKKAAARHLLDAAMENYLKALEAVTAVEHELWQQLAADHKLELGQREYRLVMTTNTLQSRPNRHGGGNCEVEQHENGDGR